MSDIREASVEPDTTRLPAGALGQAGPFLILAAGAVWLRARWDELPARLPMHWNFNGDPDRFVPRTLAGVGGPLLLGLAVCLLMVGLQLGLRHGAPRTAMRPFSLRLVLAGEYFAAFACCGVLAAAATSGRMLRPLLILTAASTAALMVATVVMARRTPRTAVRNPAAWHGGVFYVDRDDPALFVPKRRGYGYTFNFGNPLAAAMTVALLALPLLVAFFALSAR